MIIYLISSLAKGDWIGEIFRYNEYNYTTNSSNKKKGDDCNKEKCNSDYNDEYNNYTDEYNNEDYY